ncbi:N-6 DNA methylase [Pokkaliibacter sp. MBI-7]|uniref:N-6 DNA methylase n=1 Tax=Pokkaliibacter sp. MBI-7 TaxID=3040600 RepID=UPI0024469D64|nr:N-6 DNA methylase [Pokkaliibacter sp. MBI-7]MDH2433077.1 N-6 DNA methylase [Pokkaliibacter sp. MBI-7]
MARTPAADKDSAASKKTKSFEQTLWATADKLRGTVESSEYKHVVLSLIFLKFISDKFELRQAELIAEGNGDYVHMVEFYTMTNTFYLPPDCRWDYIAKQAKQDDIAVKIDSALHQIEQRNKSLRGALPDNYFSRLNIDVSKLAALIDAINNIDTVLKNEGSGEAKAAAEEDIVGRVYEYFLGNFAATEGKGGGEFYTPKCVVNLLAEMIEPYHGKIYDPCCGSGGMFVQSIKFIESHQGNKKDISIYGQEQTSTTYKLAKMNLAIRGISANLGEVPADTFFKDQHPDLKADFIMANPPFNLKDWRDEKALVDDPRWAGYETPPTGNANYGWILHMISKLSDNGVAGFVLANGSMSTSTKGEGEIRKQIIDNDLVDCMIALPGQLFYTTQIPVCLWFLTKNKKEQTFSDGRKQHRNRQGETLFIDARNMGSMIDRTHKELTAEDISLIASTYHAWRGEPVSPLPLGEGLGEGREEQRTHPKILEFARELRKNQTDAEALIWQALRGRKLADAKFRRQHPVGHFIFDFYCHEHKLAIELDGSQHYQPEALQADKARAEFLAQQGIRVIRFDNRQVLVETEAVLESIYLALSALTPGPSPKGRGEYQDVAGFCKSATLADIQANDYVLTPGRYVGAAEVEDDGELFEEKMQQLTHTLFQQMAEAQALDAVIKQNLKGLGYVG